MISVDAKKRELIGEFYNGGNKWRPKQDPRPVNAYDFVDQELGKVIPYGVYDLPLNQGWVSVGLEMIQAELDENLYAKGIGISEDEFNEILIEPDEFHGE